MKLTFRATRRIIGGTALACAAALLPGTAMASVTAPTAPSAPAVKPAWAPACRESQTLIWLGLGAGGGTAGTTFFPLEFTNVSHRTCSLFGFPTAWAIFQNGRQIGKASRHLFQRHGFVNLLPGQTAHAVLGIIEAGNVCSKPVTAASLRVRAPGQRSTTIIPFSFQACFHKRVLVVGPIQPGVGIP